MMVLVNVQSGSGLAPPTCDVLIAGGSTAALAAAITAAEADSSLHVRSVSAANSLDSLNRSWSQVCLTEPTDGDCGGQMTSSGVSAVDFGTFNREPANQPQSFRDLINYLNSQVVAYAELCLPAMSDRLTVSLITSRGNLAAGCQRRVTTLE